MGWTAPATQTTGTLVTAAKWNQQVVDNLTWLGASHDHSGDTGDGATLSFAPTGMIGMFDAACPTGWTRVSAFDGKFLYGGAAYGATGGADTHTHASSHSNHTGAHVHAVGTLAPAAASPGGISLGPGGYNAATGTHTHTLSGNSGAMADSGAVTDLVSGSSLPAYIQVVFCKKN